MQVPALYSFRFDGRTGHVFPNGFIRWGGCCFQIEAAGPALRAAIDSARTH